jgi:hypothetical protein
MRKSALYRVSGGQYFRLQRPVVAGKKFIQTALFLALYVLYLVRIGIVYTLTSPRFSFRGSCIPPGSVKGAFHNTPVATTENHGTQPRIPHLVRNTLCL